MIEEKKKSMTIISALTNNMVIGIGDKLPWKTLKDDMLNFKNKTTGNICIMGFKTWDGFGRRPLPNRINIIITSKDLSSTDELHDLEKGYDISNTYFVDSVGNALLSCESDQIKFSYDSGEERKRKIFIIGGGTIYRQFLEKDLVTNMILTVVDTVITPTKNELDEDNFVFFPDFNCEAWKSDSETKFERSERNEFDFTIEEFSRDNFVKLIID